MYKLNPRLLVILASLAFASSAFAGAYGVSCEDKSGNVRIGGGNQGLGGEGNLELDGKRYGYLSAWDDLYFGALDTLYQGDDFAKAIADPSKVVLADFASISTTRTTSFRDECKNTGVQVRWSGELVIRSFDAKQELWRGKVGCVSRGINGHCF